MTSPLWRKSIFSERFTNIILSDDRFAAKILTFCPQLSYFYSPNSFVHPAAAIFQPIFHLPEMATLAHCRATAQPPKASMHGDRAAILGQFACQSCSIVSMQYCSFVR
jgi:hypothetical protein